MFSPLPSLRPHSGLESRAGGVDIGKCRPFLPPPLVQPQAGPRPPEKYLRIPVYWEPGHTRTWDSWWPQPGQDLSAGMSWNDGPAGDGDWAPGGQPAQPPASVGSPTAPGPGQLHGVVPMLCPWVTPELARKEVPGRGCLWAEVWKCPWGKDVALLAFVSPWAGGSRPPGFMCS